ncbi:MAG TPA: hypothetical protein VLJ61_08765 [Pyrinomonadaceae bacterium]|nr:hypothetical protein [Pyrinomonadaceae bacterium]
MTKEILMVGAFSVVFACLLLGLRQLIVRARKCEGVFLVPVMREGSGRCSDEPARVLPSEASPAQETKPAAKVLTFAARHVAGTGVLAALALLFACVMSDAARAQQTIFNVPTTDVLDKGKVYAELDASFKTNDSDALGHFSSFVPRVVVGAGGRVEVGLNVTGNVQPGPDSTTLVPVVKYKVYDGSGNGYAIVVGDHLFIPVRNKSYDAGNYVYLEFSKTFKGRGTRLTAGAFDFTKNVVAARNRAGSQFGFEQPVGKKLTMAADYFTGKHAAGYFTPGAVFKLTQKLTGYAGYSIGNQNPSRGNHFFLLELGYNFN